MPKRPTGSRTVPGVAKGRGSASNSGNTGRSYKSTHGTKTPTGARPVPGVARNTPKSDGVPGGGRVATRPTSMPAPKQRHGTRGGGKAHGGN